jgi:hypothetical protein
MSDPPDQPDVEIRASVKARELTFNKPPRTRVEPYAEPDGQSGSASSRRNLPDQVQPGETYEDVEVDYKTGAKLADKDASQQPEAGRGGS